MKFQTADEYIDHIRNSGEFDASTPHNGCTVYSNDKTASGHLNAMRAEALTQDGVHTRIEGTPGGKWLMEEQAQFKDKFTCEQQNAIWDAASEKFAQSASGDVTTRCVGANDFSVFRQTEMPALLKNENVTSINGVPREELKLLDYKDACEKIGDAELAVSRKEIAAAGNRPEDVNDLQRREGVHGKQVAKTEQTRSDFQEYRDDIVVRRFDAPPPPPPPSKPPEESPVAGHSP